MNDLPFDWHFDWDRAEADMRAAAAIVLDHPTVTLADVGGLAQVKSRLVDTFRHRVSGLILYGPPACGKRFLAKAIAGELGASFVSVSLADALDMQAFGLARRSVPCLLLLDELDAIRPRQRLELLAELDGLTGDNTGVFVLAATNAPWHVDLTLRGPGRLDRTLLVLPPDTAARAAILRHHLRDRWLAPVDVGHLAARTEGMTGGDLANVCEAAAERALLDSAVSGSVRMIEMRDLNAALAEIRPSARAWFDTARHEAGGWDELVRYFRNQPG